MRQPPELPSLAQNVLVEMREEKRVRAGDRPHLGVLAKYLAKVIAQNPRNYFRLFSP